MEATVIPLTAEPIPPAAEIPAAALLEDVEMQWRGCYHEPRTYLEAPDPDPKSSFIITFALNGQPEQMTAAVHARLAEGKRHGLQALADVRQEFQSAETFQKMKRLENRLAAERAAVDQADAGAKEALSRARAALQSGEDPASDEGEYRECLGDKSIHENRCNALVEMIGSARRVAEAEMHDALVARQKELLGVARTKAQSIRDEVAGLLATYLPELLFWDGCESGLIKPDGDWFLADRQLPIAVETALPAA
jgi:hypothetical protein